ncbi:conserved hypothetical protein [Talaromyces stipitatus ATCC 10500]|uniref:Uncharacterized protein n=1 Tax=Talaromyces stipitatus (strain ATCC 10500 / CBS 375.48 / QM 6759 / NRRL 1006) TaxID=441959 RepID=B8MB92_TALSN|nr:uncharacterized protein TSTA_125930 [Talaromyces stipitatus ATCC 10500]EED18881.1 conserved hypothetical protein [Talaromyces stipitatus ATCC 10500]
MASHTYILFDIPTKAPQVCWSMNTWRTRLLLNYKGLDYKTEWLEYPNIGVRLGHHVPPNEQGPHFTLPAIQLPDGSYVMDSYKIADIIEERHLEPRVHRLNIPAQLTFRNILTNLMRQLTPLYIPGIAQRLLSNESIDFFIAARQKDVGMPLDEYGKQHGPGAFDRAEPFLHEMTALLDETAGPYFLGDTVSYTDFIWAAILLFFKCFGDDIYGELLMRSGNSQVHTEFLDALSQWTKRNDYLR